MKRSWNIGPVVVVTALLLLAGHAASGQGLTQEVVKGIVKSLDTHAMQVMMTQIVSEAAKDPELRKQLLQVMVPEVAKAVEASMRGNVAAATPRHCD